MSLASRAAIGLAIGAIFLWLAISHVDMEGAASAVQHARIGPLVASLLIYWIAIGLRTTRWRKLLSGAADLSFVQVAQCLIIGYAINNILPARLGELFRIDYLRRHYGVARSAGLGSVLIERLGDGLIAITFLVLGLNLPNLNSEHSALVYAATVATVGVAFVLVGLYVLLSKRHWLPLEFGWFRDRLEIFTSAITSIGSTKLVQVAILSVVIWSLEAFAIWLIAWAFDVVLTFGALCLVFGSAALSTLIPSAPAYIGSLQAAFVLSFSALGLATLPGLLSATITQLLLFGSITLIGLTLLFAKHLRGVLAFLARGGEA